MEGQEEAMSFYGQRVLIDEVKNATLDSGSMTRRRLPWSLKLEMTHALTTWMAQKVEDDCFNALAAFSGTAFTTTNETTKDTWLLANTDRVLFGNATSNMTTNDHSASLGTIDTSNDVCNAAQITLAKRLAQLASPKLRPIKIENGEEYYVAFIHPYCARDLKADSAWQNAQLYSAARGSSNPIFTGMLGIYDGVIIKETPKILIATGAGAATSDVAANFLCGAQALVFGQGGYDNGERVVMTDKLFDYDSKQGVQIKNTYGVSAAEFNSKVHGTVRFYSSAMAD
jgi:N4-gp56 family major capsid protein